jgi:hypothetical protein
VQHALEQGHSFPTAIAGQVAARMEGTTGGPLRGARRMTRNGGEDVVEGLVEARHALDQAA